MEPAAGTWKTFVLSSQSELRLPPPPDAGATAVEIRELQALKTQRKANVLDQISYWDAGAPGYRWNEIAMSWGLKRGIGLGALIPLLNVAIYDATIAAWNSKYAFNRPRQVEIDPSLAPAVATPNSPSYPSEHAAAAGAAAAILGYVMPQDAQFFADKAEEAASSRVSAGVQYPSDVKAGLELGRAVAVRVIERAKTDGFDAKWDGTVPVGPGKWVGTNPNIPLAGTWKTWLVPWDGKPSVGPPPPYDSEAMTKALDEVKNFKRTQAPVAPFWAEDPAGRPAPGSAPVATDQAAYHWAIFNHLQWGPETSQKIFEYRWDTNPPRAARAYALVSIAAYDTTVACWGTRYVYWAARPNNLDPTLVTLFPTPAQPSYPSGHSCIAGATSRTLEYLFPRDAHYFRSRAEELAASRLWAGIHFRDDNEDGLKLGRAVAEKVIEWGRHDGS
jgi:membrane-associated phospholipid phosphatase